MTLIAFIHAQRRYPFRVPASITHRQTAGTYLASLGLKKGKDCLRTGVDWTDAYTGSADDYHFRRQVNATVFALWIPDEPNEKGLMILRWFAIKRKIRLNRAYGSLNLVLT